jgi:hypothetical protein
MGNEKLDKLNEVYDKYKDEFTGQFHSVLWKIMVGGKNRTWVEAFHCVYREGGLELVLALPDDGGYIPTMTWFVNKYRDHAMDLCYKLNEEVFGYSRQEANTIMLQSMKLKA